MRVLHRLADNADESSLASRMRRRRFDRFRQLLSSVAPPLRILDLGGTERFWQVMGFGGRQDLEIVLVNPQARTTRSPSITGVTGDACDLPYDDGEFDVVFSNSVIEHVGAWRDQVRMASEVHRVGRRFFVQTPNRYFPIEPHFLVPGFQFMPFELRVGLIRNFPLGHLISSFIGLTLLTGAITALRSPPRPPPQLGGGRGNRGGRCLRRRGDCRLGLGADRPTRGPAAAGSDDLCRDRPPAGRHAESERQAPPGVRPARFAGAGGDLLAPRRGLEPRRQPRRGSRGRTRGGAGGCACWRGHPALLGLGAPPAGADPRARRRPRGRSARGR